MKFNKYYSILSLPTISSIAPFRTDSIKTSRFILLDVHFAHWIVLLFIMFILLPGVNVKIIKIEKNGNSSFRKTISNEKEIRFAGEHFEIHADKNDICC